MRRLVWSGTLRLFIIRPHLIRPPLLLSARQVVDVALLHGNYFAEAICPDSTFDGKEVFLVHNEVDGISKAREAADKCNLSFPAPPYPGLLCDHTRRGPFMPNLIIRRTIEDLEYATYFFDSLAPQGLVNITTLRLGQLLVAPRLLSRLLDLPLLEHLTINIGHTNEEVR